MYQHSERRLGAGRRPGSWLKRVGSFISFEFDFYLLAKSMEACDAGAPQVPHKVCT